MPEEKSGNTAAMRAALEAVKKVGYPHNFQREAYHIRSYCEEITEAVRQCIAALEEPPRRCDLPDCATYGAAVRKMEEEAEDCEDPLEWILETVDANREETEE